MPLGTIAGGVAGGWIGARKRGFWRWEGYGSLNFGTWVIVGYMALFPFFVSCCCPAPTTAIVATLFVFADIYLDTINRRLE